MSTEKKVFIGIGLVTILIMAGGIFLLSSEDDRLKRPFMGQEVKIESKNHVPDGTEIQYNSNPPAGGPHYETTAHAGIYDTPPPDGNLVHSLEHGAVIIWYKSDLPKDQVEKLKSVFKRLSGKKIMVPRQSLDVPVAVSSWGRVLQLRTINGEQIKAFFETNYNRGPENAPI